MQFFDLYKREKKYRTFKCDFALFPLLNEKKKYWVCPSFEQALKWFGRVEKVTECRDVVYYYIIKLCHQSLSPFR